MVELTTANSQVTLTHDHLMYVYHGGRWVYMFSERVQPGMMVQVVGGTTSNRIETVQSVQR